MGRRPGGDAAIRARLAAAPGLTTAEGHRLAGFLDAEAHLAVVPNNRHGWRCYCSVQVRDDDVAVLVDASDRMGLGTLVPVPARNKSRPQVRWTIQSKLECLKLVDLLDTHPLRARKMHEYAVWREAVALWGARKYGIEPKSRARLGRLADLIKLARVYREPHPDAALPALTDPYAPHYFTGFFSGEGCFALAPRSARFVIRVRRDDRPLLDAFCRDFRIGSVCDGERSDPGSPVAVWHVTAFRAVLRGIEIFETAGLLGRKERQFRAWKPGAEALVRAKIAGEPVDDELIEGARRRLREVSAYIPPADGVREEAPAVSS